MDWIERKINKRYYDSDVKKLSKVLGFYWKVKRIVMFIPRAVASTYLCARFPFLKFNIRKGFFQRYCWYWLLNGSVSIARIGLPDFNGWRKAFGLQLCKELKAELKRHGMLHSYQITTIKEKFGALCIYDEGAPKEVHDILNKYEYISSRTCVSCGRNAKYMSRGWIEPYCEDCAKKIGQKDEFDEYYKDFDWYGWTK